MDRPKRSVRNDWLGKVPFWTIHRFNMRAPTTMGIGRNESPCTGLSAILSYVGTSAHRSGLQVNILQKSLAGVHFRSAFKKKGFLTGLRLPSDGEQARLRQNSQLLVSIQFNSKATTENSDGDYWSREKDGARTQNPAAGSFD